jgi:hypothetical protein
LSKLPTPVLRVAGSLESRLAQAAEAIERLVRQPFDL